MQNLSADLEELRNRACELGASATKIVEVAGIRTGAWTRMKCQYGCPNYGLNLCCPPYTPSYEQMRAFLAEYAKAILVEYTFPLKKEDCV